METPKKSQEIQVKNKNPLNGIRDIFSKMMNKITEFDKKIFAENLLTNIGVNYPEIKIIKTKIDGQLEFRELIKDILENLYIIYFQKFNNKEISKEEFDAKFINYVEKTKAYLKEKYPELYVLFKDFTGEKIKNDFEKMFNLCLDGEKLEQNHKLVSQNLKLVINLLNENDIDYYLVGALPSFLETKIGLFRIHDDIDIMINEDDIEKVIELLKSQNFKIIDNRLENIEEKTRFPHVLQANPIIDGEESDFHIGIFGFKNVEDGIILQDFVDDVQFICQKTFDMRYKKGVKIHIGESEFETNSSCIEAIYDIKKYTLRPKDKLDVAMLEPYVDIELVKKLKKELNS